MTVGRHGVAVAVPGRRRRCRAGVVGVAVGGVLGRRGRSAVASRGRRRRSGSAVGGRRRASCRSARLGRRRSVAVGRRRRWSTRRRRRAAAQSGREVVGPARSAARRSRCRSRGRPPSGRLRVDLAPRRWRPPRLGQRPASTAVRIVVELDLQRVGAGLPGSALERRRRRPTASAAASAERPARVRCEDRCTQTPTDRTAGARRASPAAARRGSPPGRPATSYSARRHSARQPLEVEQQPGGARVAVARLADAAGVEEPLALGEVDARRRRGAARRSPARPRARRTTARRGSGRRARPAGLDVEAQLGQQRAQHVLPDRVARAGVVEPEPSRLALRADSARSHVARARACSTSWVQRAAMRGAAGELVERQLAGHRQVVVAGQADRRVLADAARSSRWGRRRSRRGRPGTRSRRHVARSTSASTASRAWRLPWMSERIAMRMDVAARAAAAAARSAAKLPGAPAALGRAGCGARPRAGRRRRTRAGS